MSALINLQDVPTVTAADLMRIMQRLIASENGLIFLNGITEASRSALEDAIWATFENDPGRRLAVMLRFECLVDLFSSRRMRDQFTQHGLALLAPAFAIAAEQRLNTEWGFNPQKFLLDLIEKLSAKPAAETSTPAFPIQIAAQHDVQQLAA